MSIKGFSIAAAGAVALLCGVATPAAAQTTMFDFRGSNTPLSGTAGNSKTFTNSDGTITAIVTAWSLSTPNGTPTAAYLGRYTNGLGVTNGNEGNGSADNSHTIDNVGSYDFVTIGFSRPVQLLFGTLTPFDVGPGSADNDPSISFSYDPLMSPTWNANAIVTNASLWADLKLHTTEQFGNLSSPYATNLNPGMNTGNVWTIGANRLFDMAPGRNDGFKLAGITVQLPVPEPATWAMMIVGFGVVGGSLRQQGRRRAMLAAA